MELQLTCWLLCLVFMAKPCRVSTYFRIEPEEIDENENRNVTFTCSVSDENSRLRWKFREKDICLFYTNTCQLLSSLNDSRKTCSCHNDISNKTQLSLHLTNISSVDHNASVTCIVLDENESRNKSTRLYVKVPVKELNIMPLENTIEMRENSSITLNCSSSDSRPIQKITWTVSKHKDQGFQLNGTQTDFSLTNGLFSALNTLNYQFNRHLNGWKIYCIVSKQEHQEEIRSKFITLNITYPPESKLKVNGYSTDVLYSVIAGDTGTLICTIFGGNPKPFLSWNKCFDNENCTRVAGSFTSQTENYKLTWHATPHTDRNCTCQSIQKERNESVAVFVDILYPPTIPTFTYGSLNVSRIIYILLKEQLSLDCNSESKPPPTYQWILKNGTMLDSKILLIQKTHIMDQGQYTCKTMNEMRAANRTKTGSNKGDIELQVLHPPSVDELKDHTVVEKENVNISCPIIYGNPNETIVRWTSAGKKTWPSQFLTISNVSKHDDMNYNCSIYNTMTPTGKSSVNGTDSGMFHLIVEYYTSVKKFYANEYRTQNDVTVNESENVTFICDIDSNPISNTSLKFGAVQTLFWTNSNTLNYTHALAKCTDAGTYFCYCKNKHNIGIGSQKQLNLFVRCSPRVNPKIPYKVNITSALNVSATLQIPILAYPTSETVVWQKLTVSNWTNITSNYNITISGIEHNVSLTIYNVSETDFGRYKLIISNDAGLYESVFNIIPEERPKPPTGFKIIDHLTTTTSATVQWFPSFNGGRSQTFVLNYSQSQQNYWTQILIRDTGKLIMNYTINQLSSGSLYYIILHSENSIGSSDLSQRIEIHTKDIPDTTDESLIGVVIGSVCGVIGALLIIVLIICSYKNSYASRRCEKATEMIYQNVPNFGNHKGLKQSKHTSLINETHFCEETLQEIDDIPQNAYEITEYSNSAKKIQEIDKIRLSELFQYVLGQSDDDFAAEYQQIPTELQSATAFARKPENIALNRYNGILPYDHSRVKISDIPDFFMNACYIDGYKSRNAYIASLGPTEKTSNDFVTFWQMVWYEKSDLIVMLTNLREPSGMKCEQYWPNSGISMHYREFRVTSLSTEILAEFTKRKFELSKGKDQRTITHLHFTAWPDKTIPEDTTSLIEFRQQMKTATTSSAGPIIVHCSAGIGRTGTLIAFDRLVAEGQDRHGVNVFECVKSMRKQRVKMVQTLEQYIYIYKALVCALCFGSKYMTVQELRKFAGTTKRMCSKEFQQLKQTVDTVTKDEKEALKKNETQTNENRPGADVPGNQFRVFLKLKRQSEDTDYINAVYINSFVKKEFFILAQTPLPEYTEDFICMIYQENCICVVTMNDQKDSYQNIGRYLPDGDKFLKIGNFKVSCSLLETKPHYTLKKTEVCYEGRYKRGEKIVYHFHYTKWLAEMETPEKLADFVQFVKDVHQYACEVGDERSHVLVHCLKANERSGLFCTILIILEKLDKERKVNISNTIRHLRTRRRSAITSMEQLQFCYQAASLYAKQFHN